MTQRYKIKLTGPGLNIDREIAEVIAQQVVMLTLGADRPTTPQRSQPGASTQRPATRSGGQELSIAEFLTDSQAKRGPDKLTAIAVYLRDHRSKAAFSIPDLKKGFEDAAESVPGNLPRDINWAKRVGWIAPKAGQRGMYYVTGTGAQAVTRKFPPDVLKKTKLGRRRKRQKAAAARS